MEYILKDNFDNTEKIVSENELRDLYLKSMEEIIYNWKDCGDEKIILDLEKEKSEVFTCNIEKVIRTLEEDNWFYEIKEVKN